MSRRECWRCHAELAEPTFEQALEMEQNYRANFPNTWDTEYKGVNRVLICDDCFFEMNEEQTPEQFEIEQIMKEDTDE